MYESRCDVIIVGRGIYQSYADMKDDDVIEKVKEDVIEKCLKYRDAGWNAYLDRTIELIEVKRYS